MSPRLLKTTVALTTRVRSAIRPARCAVARRALALAACALGLAAPATAAVLTLDDAIRLALERNPALKVSQFSPQIARANVLAAYGAFDPAITFERSYTESEAAGALLSRPLSQTDDYALALGGLTPWGARYSLEASARRTHGPTTGFVDSFTTFGGLRVTQPLLRGFGFGTTLASLRIAKADRGIADWQYRQVVIDTVTSVVYAYNNLLQARENLRIAQLSRDLAMETLRQNVARNRVGALSDADVIQARSTAASRDDSILIAEQAARDRENELRQLVGETRFFIAGGQLEIDVLPPASPISVDVAADLKRAYDLRPDFQAARLGIVRRQASHAQAKNQLLPTVNFVGVYGYNGVDRDFATARRQVRGEDARAYSAGVEVSIPLTFAEGRGRARAAQLALRQSEADLSRLQTDIAVDITSAAGQLETTRKRVETNRTALELARQSLDAEQKKINAGTGSTFLVLQAQGILVQVERNYVAALADERRARASYEREIGATLELRHIKLD
jgi:outer membrane protein TolC